MSELKAIRSGEIYNIIEYEDCYRTDELYYPKYEADKVIAEKDKEIARLDDLAHAHNIELLRKENLIEELKHQRDGAFGLTNSGLTLDDLSQIARKEIDRHKYKRCLAMARWCMARYNEWVAYYPTTTTRKMKFLDKWEKRWLAIAYKFKEAK